MPKRNKNGVSLTPAPSLTGRGSRPPVNPAPKEENLPSSCRPALRREGQGFLMGLLYGLVPHTFCILFIVLSVIGATAATSLVRRFLYIPYIFQIIVALSFVFATISALLFLRQNGLLSLAGIRFKWKYLTVMYGTTIGINLFFFLVVFPLLANLNFRPVTPVVSAQTINAASATGLAPAPAAANSANAGQIKLQVNIPCPGHAPLIMDELKKLDGVTGATYQFPNTFVVNYDAARVTPEKILALEVFRSFPARVQP